MSERDIVVRVDHDLCIGNAMCREAAPATFAADDSGQSVVTDPEASSLDSLLDAAAMCPVGAVLVLDAKTGRALGE
jgi:ferredoxin